MLIRRLKEAKFTLQFAGVQVPELKMSLSASQGEKLQSRIPDLFSYPAWSFRFVFLWRVCHK